MFFPYKASIVIDPGHGGKDFGAVGPSGLSEKKVTLDIAKRMRRLIKSAMPYVRVTLTRERDTYVSLNQRVKIAEINKADVFISIHINSSTNIEAKGFEIYSLDVASGSYASRLAAQENKSFNADEDRGVKLILADLRAVSNRTESDMLASFITRGFISQIKKGMPAISISDRGLQQALFNVLFVRSPAVLTELFFISNPEEERMLLSAKVRELCARGLFLGIAKYLSMREKNHYANK